MSYLHIPIFILAMTSTANAFANYNMFTGFDVRDITNTTLESKFNVEENPEIFYEPEEANIVENRTVAKENIATVTPTISKQFVEKNRSIIVDIFTQPLTSKQPDRASQETTRKTVKVKSACPEEEQPSTIGPYEVPTPRELVLVTHRMLRKMFDSFHMKTFKFLRDIKEALKSTSATNCGDQRHLRLVYKQCVTRVANVYETHANKMAALLERQRHEIDKVNEDTVCNISQMRNDPIQLLKTLAVEEVSLHFALPSFLRLLSGCSRYCRQSAIGDTVSTVPEDWTRSQRIKEPYLK